MRRNNNWRMERTLEEKIDEKQDGGLCIQMTLILIGHSCPFEITYKTAYKLHKTHTNSEKYKYTQRERERGKRNGNNTHVILKIGRGSN